MQGQLLTVERAYEIFNSAEFRDAEYTAHERNKRRPKALLTRRQLWCRAWTLSRMEARAELDPSIIERMYDTYASGGCY